MPGFSRATWFTAVHTYKNCIVLCWSDLECWNRFWGSFFAQVVIIPALICETYNKFKIKMSRCPFIFIFLRIYLFNLKQKAREQTRMGKGQSVIDPRTSRS